MLDELKAVMAANVATLGKLPRWVVIPYLKLLEMQLLGEKYWDSRDVHQCVIIEGIRVALASKLGGKLEGVDVVVPAQLDYEGSIEAIN